jgi:hypothetical protein
LPQRTDRAQTQLLHPEFLSRWRTAELWHHFLRPYAVPGLWRRLCGESDKRQRWVIAI